MFYGFLEFGIKGVVGEDIVGEMGFDGFENRNDFRDFSGTVSTAMDLKVFDHDFQLHLQLNQVSGRH